MAAEESHEKEIVKEESATTRSNLKSPNVVRSSLERASADNKSKSKDKQSTQNINTNSLYQSSSATNADKKTLVDNQQKPDWNSVYNNAMRVYYGANGQRSGIAKRK